MAKKISLANRKVNKQVHDTVGQEKKDILRAMQLQELNEQASRVGEFFELPLSLVKPDANQPRKSFKNIESLAASIKENGVIQPIIVTAKKNDGTHYIIAGERRYLASQQAGLATIPCIVRQEESDASILLLQLLENDQREGVSPFEEADALRDLIEQKNVKKAEIAKVLGREASWISMRLKIADAKSNIRALADNGVIEDVRTLYELKKFAEEMPEGAHEFVEKALANKISGSYRSAITRYRDNWKRKAEIIDNEKMDIISIKNISKDDNILRIKGARAGSKSYTYSFEITDEFKQLLFDALIK
ncbi:ParB/RepB/Spo0J family partition protein [Francisella adeliensis]|uniref:Chromosome partitioning protein ParB n=1 Tax=Francisella adeliensis TaxID=2007306 RepID=A0A2Z4XWW1_9GAMM|nr:ParB/RepB/Spo0J family partition protein [Francisella adeliensis]AXA33209.1 chromosome partitioning protein ParB [Francisella adeliensis]MBK2085071.1 ParB/RepB/Spo0J family partition protein [Francisella adeliensis]MBK2096938.1 ParB/RepB/Spo0J family partition protein [Francisella adeliensis]QIW11437.1 ParB/RepB/Spo0J family partition protein [Francisella adeliensis]QIW13312.1 ParB/RepB/Spo0J family partition protein [Francisella adeliensis]